MQLIGSKGAWSLRCIENALTFYAFVHVGVEGWVGKEVA